MTDGPERPRLSSRAALRQHLIGGRPQLALHVEGQAGVVLLGPRERTLLEAADGTRDLAGIRAHAVSEGVKVAAGELRQFFGQLQQVGAIDSGPRQPVAPVAEMAGERPLEPLPGYALHCDGRGSCCRIYPTTLFSSLESARARSCAPERLAGGEGERELFTPECGGQILGARSVTMCDGRCAYLEVDGRCLLHLRGGVSAKPLGCRMFPLQLVDDGERIAVSVAPECACVFASAGLEGEALLGSAQTGADLDPGVFVRRLESSIALGGGHVAPLARYRAWARQWRDAEPDDVAIALWRLAGAARRGELPTPATLVALDGDRSEAMGDEAVDGTLLDGLVGLRRAVERLQRRDIGWRAPHDLVLRVSGWLLDALAVLDAPLPPAQAPQDERLYLRASMHGHRFSDDGLLADGLAAGAVQLMAARLMAKVAPPVAAVGDGAFDYPLALVEALVRGHGLAC